VIAYIDSSVLLRVVHGQPDHLSVWSQIDHGVTSAFTQVECLRTLDRRCLQGLLDVDDLAERRGLTLQILRRLERVDIGPAILRRAADSFPVPLGTLDAIHLSTALVWWAARNDRPVMATHDRQLATASTAVGLEVIGATP
jgi:predicted nucleic acid-binding protein